MRFERRATHRGLRTVIAALLAVLLVPVTPALAAPTQEARSWQDQLIGGFDAPPTGNAVELKTRMLVVLDEIRSEIRSGVLENVSSDLTEGRSYALDGWRPLDTSRVERLYQHDKQLAVDLQALLVSSRGGAAAETAALHLLTAANGTAESLLADARVIEPDSKLTLRAAKDIQKAQEQWGRGHLVAALQHYGKGASNAMAVLAEAGIDYRSALDSDGNGLSDLVELLFGADPRVADTDGDGLDDEDEILRGAPYLMPGLADTDGDGIPDGQEDTDGDGLSALREAAIGTDDLQPDTDRDRLTDLDEFEVHGTDPTAADPDQDGLADAGELRAGTDPFDPDSDDDGVLDGADLITGTVTDSGVTVSVAGVGDIAGTVEITPIAFPKSSTPGLVSDPIDVTVAAEAEDDLVEVTLTLPFEASQVTGSISDLRVFWFDESANLWMPAAPDEQQTVDAAAGTVTVTVNHLSVYAIFEIRNWSQIWSGIGGSCDDRGGGGGNPVLVDVALTIDSSGSMTSNDPQGLRRTAAKSFVDALLAEDRAAVVDFDSSARLFQALTSDKAAVKAAIDRINSSGGTNIGAGVRVALDELAANDDADRAQLVILLTDGVGSYSTDLTARAVADQVVIYTIGLGPGVDSNLLRSIAEQTGGQYYPVASADDLPDVFRDIEDDQGDTGEDTDEDGLTDCVEEEGIRSSSRGPIVTNPLVADTDDDGVDDGEEAGPSIIERDPTGTYPTDVVYTLWSDPTKPDTDDDGLFDGIEYDFGSDPWVGNSDSDTLGDEEERNQRTDPRRSDTDGDGFDDAYEIEFEDDGFNPLFPDERVSKWRHVGDFFIGLTAGDAIQMDSLSWLGGNLASGGLSFIPVIGWIVGGIADLRDTIANSIRGDWVGAGLSGAGIVPYAGDAVAIVGKTAKFVGRNVDKLDEVAQLVARIDDIPIDVRARVIRESAQEVGADIGVLSQKGFTDADIVELAKRGRTDWKALQEMVEKSTDGLRVGSPGFRNGWRDGEDWFRQIDGGSEKYLKVPGFSRGRFIDSCTNCDDLINAVAKEVKTGFVGASQRRRNEILRQIDKDAALRAEGVQIEWHFLPNGRNGTVGAHPDIIDRLVQRNIPFTVYAPGT